jgi:predicted nicotinamide N-methyase
VNSEDFVRAHTRLTPAPYLPELALHTGEDIVALWEQTETWAARGGLAPPFWAFPWAGGTGLARHLLDHPEQVAGRQVLDVATGSGVVGIAAASAGAARVLVNDVDPLALVAATLNAEANGVQVVAWPGDLLAPDGPGLPADVDLVLAGDVFYDRELAGQMLPLLHRAAQGGARVLIGDPGRRYLPRTLLLPLARYDVPVPRDLESTDLATVTVWWLPSRGEADA